MLLGGKVAIITGSSRGIGRAVAVGLAKAGAKVVINYAGNRAAAEAVAETVKAGGGEAVLCQGDVSKAEIAEELVKTAMEAFGRVDILVNNAGITRDGLLIRMKEEDWDAVLTTNLKGVFNCTKAAARVMMKQKSGKIINMASVIGQMGNAGQANYAAAKAGVIGFTKATARELASRGITANAVAPGFILTDMTAAIPEQAKEEHAKQIPLGRAGTPEDVAAAVLFLASDAANYITGQTINVDGGMVMQ
ncbi:MAG TPA: 3-oxoacyl-[acyl-carrier-protein] reductase [Selenomonadales bacterium]|nr:3-oxoacyl-[acyl-carrier-protein] reductase [Selenomonadales bacterium]